MLSSAHFAGLGLRAASTIPSFDARIVAVLDVDSFEVQVYQKQEKWAFTKGKPTVVVDTSSGRIVAVSPEAKAAPFLITRKDKEGSAKQKCPQLIVIPKDIRFDKPDSKLLREASYQLRDAITGYIDERKMQDGLNIGNAVWEAKVPIALSGSDEFFVDLTNFIHVHVTEDDAFMVSLDFEEDHKVVLETVNGSLQTEDINERIGHHMKESGRLFRTSRQRYDNQEIRMIIAAQMMDELKDRVKEEAGFECSVGIGSNKIRSKIACKLNKPGGVTALLDEALPRIATSFNFREIQGFGSELGDRVEERYGSMTMKELQDACKNLSRLVADFGPGDAGRIQKIANAESNEAVENKFVNEKLNCGKTNLSELYHSILTKYIVRIHVRNSRTS